MKRYENLINSECLACGEWLCVTAGAYRGEINCTKCGAINRFADESRPSAVELFNGENPVTASSISHRETFVSSE